ncbi:MAG: LuxR C-terminal-related transcriptional regulator, partial [candidate division Zixibacteria bacterium]|nr:LuxR C-terminal-related transcriptional regulator [candidate division Zixibacteria bacterium]
LALRTEREALHAKNVALKEIMGQVEEEKQHMARYVHTNVSRILLPLLTSLERRIYPEGEQYIRLIKNCLDDITGPYLSQLESQFFQLTPRELEICNMIRNGLSSKEIAETLNTSEQTVLKQRTMVRRKLGLAGSKTNLVAFLNRIG